MPDLHSSLKGPYFFLILGIVMLLMGLIATLTGVAWARFGRVIYRAKEPRAFWEDVVTSYALGICLIGYFFYRAL